MIGLSTSSYLPFSSSLSTKIADNYDSVMIGNVGAVKSMSMWFRPDAAINSSSSVQRLCGFSGTVYYGISLGGATTAFTGETLTVLGDSGSRSATTRTFDADTWYHLLVSYNDTSDHWDIFINGVAENDLSTTAKHDPLVSWDYFILGCTYQDLNDASDTHFEGKIDEVGIWSVSLDVNDAIALYNEGKPTELTSSKGSYNSQASLTGWWRMGEGCADDMPHYSSSSVSDDNTTYGVVVNQLHRDCGADLYESGAGSFDSGVSGWIAYDNNTWTNVSNQLVLTCVDNAAGGYNYFRDADGTHGSLTTNLTLGVVYKITVRAKYTGGSNPPRIRVEEVITGPAPNRIDLTTEFQDYILYFEAGSAGSCYFRCEDMDTGVGQTVTLDNIKIEPMHSTTGIVVGLQDGFDSNSAG